MADGNSPGGRGFLSADALGLYKAIARREPVAEADKGVLEELVAWGAVGFTADHPDVPVALDPEPAARRRFYAEVQEAKAQMERLTVLPGLMDELAQEYQRVQLHAGGGSEYLDDPATVNARLDDVVGRAEWEILSAQPGGPRTRELLDRSVMRDTAALGRGVALRTMYRDTVRDTTVTAEFAAVMSGRGADYRTMIGPFQRCIVVDRTTAFISNYIVEGAPAHAAWHVTDRAMVAFIAEVYEEHWRRASPWHGELRGRGTVQVVDTVSGPDGGVRTSCLQREILRDMAAGIEQRITAVRLGISVRKLTDEIAALKAMWGAQTRPELTYRWALSPERAIDDSAPQVAATAARTAA